MNWKDDMSEICLVETKINRIEKVDSQPEPYLLPDIKRFTTNGIYNPWYLKKEFMSIIFLF